MFKAQICGLDLPKSLAWGAAFVRVCMNISKFSCNIKFIFQFHWKNGIITNDCRILGVINNFNSVRIVS